MSNIYAFTTTHLNKSYKDCVALKDLSFTINYGEVFGLIGENGAGKTTLMKIIAGCSNATSGKMSILGASERHLKEARKEMGVIIENPAYYGDMTGAENLEIIRLAKQIKGKTIIDTSLDLVGLLDVKSKKVNKYSLGMKQRLGLAMALIGSPKFLILDEPTNGLDPNGIVEMRNIINRLNKEKGITILISSHILTELNQLATRYGILHGGKLIALHSAQELHEKCQKRIKLLHNDSTDKIESFIKQYQVANMATDGKWISFDYATVFPNNFLEILFNAKFNIIEYYSHQESLEDYFVRLTKRRCDQC